LLPPSTSSDTPAASPKALRQQPLPFFPQAIAVAMGVVFASAIIDVLNAQVTSYAEAAIYAALIAVPGLGLLLYRKNILSSITIGLFADASLTLLLLTRLALGFGSVSGTAVFLTMKILGTALLFPWGGPLQLLTSSLSTALYWLLLYLGDTPIESGNWLHQVWSPLIATLLAAAGAVISERVRDEHARAEAQLSMSLTRTRRAEVEKAGLLDIARDLSGTVDRAKVVRQAQIHTASLLGCDSVATIVLDASATVFHVIGAHGPFPHVRDEVLATTFPAVHSALANLDAGRSIIVNAHQGREIFPAGVLERFGVHHLILSPLRVADRFFGALVAIRTQNDAPFEPRQTEILEAIAAQLALALEVIELYRQAKDDAEASATIALVARSLIETVGMATLMPRLCELTRTALACDAVVVHQRTTQAPHFIATAVSGLPDDDWEILRSLPMPAALAEEQARHSSAGEPWQAPVPAEPQTDLGALAKRLGFTRFLHAPLLHAGHLVGVLTAIYRGNTSPFAPRQVQIVKSIGQLASLVWQNTQLIEQLELANRTQSDFVATMSHELRTPLNIISGYTNLLLDDAFGPLNEEQSATLERVALSSKELVELVNTTLHVSRLDTGRVPIEVSRFSVADLFDEVTTQTREVWNREGLTLTWNADDTIPLLRSDRVKLKVILKNLIGNAAKFTEAGTIELRAAAVDKGVQIAVMDTGVGIPAEALPVIFQRFRQADSSMTRRFGGVGLGLYIVSRLLEMLGGSIEVASTVGRGTTFTLFVPNLSPRP